MEFLEETIALANSTYGDILDIKFDTFNQVEHFLNVLSRKLSNATFLVFTGRCERCHANKHGHWTYVDETTLTVETLVKFLRHLKTQGILCVHERVSGLQLSHFLCNIQINVRRTREEIQKASA